LKISKKEWKETLDGMRAVLANSVVLTTRKSQRKSAADINVYDLKPEDFSISKYLRRGVWPDGPWKDDDNEVALLKESVNICKALGQDTGTRGGFFVPPKLTDELIERLAAVAVVRGMPGVKVVPVVGTDTLWINRVSAGPTITWAGESESLSEDTTMALDRVALTVHKATCIYKISRDLLINAGPMVDTLVREEIGREMAIEEDQVILQGTGGKQPLGIYLQPDVLSTDLSAVIDTDDLKAAIYRIMNENANLTGWVCHPRTKDTLAREKDGNGRYVHNQANLIGSPGVTAAGVPSLLGYPAKHTTQIAITNRPSSDESYMVGGEWRHLMIGEKPGMRIETSSERYFEEDNVALKVIKYVGYALRHGPAFVVIKGIQA